MQPDFWHERWRLGLIGFHQSAVERMLVTHWARLQVTEGGVLVPLCGKSLDLVWLRDLGLQVTGIELSSVAVESFCLEQGVLARRANDGVLERFESPGLRLLHGDFFSLNVNTDLELTHFTESHRSKIDPPWAPFWHQADAVFLAV